MTAFTIKVAAVWTTAALGFSALLFATRGDGCCVGDDPELEKALNEKFKVAVENIPVVLRHYAESIGCEFNLDPSNIVQYTFERKTDYVSVFSLDNGCTTGTAMSRSIFALLQTDGYQRKFLISAEHSAPHQTSDEFPPRISRLYVKDAQLHFEGLELDPATDALCCPSIKISGHVLYKDGKWVPVDKTSSKELRSAPWRAGAQQQGAAGVFAHQDESDFSMRPR